MNLDRARPLAERLRTLLAPYCERIEIAGSIRRGKREEISDIELVAIPRVERRETLPAIASLFGAEAVASEPVSLLDEYLERAVSAEQSPLRKDHIRRPCWGPRMKKLLYAGAPVDLFLVLPPAQWGVIFAIRTGPADWSRRLVTPQLRGGLLPTGLTISSGCLIAGSTVIATPEESDLFAALGLPWEEPSDRR